MYLSSDECIPFTERSSGITCDFDMHSPEVMIQKLRDSDYEIFSTICSGCPGLMSKEFLSKLENLSFCISSMMVLSSAPIFEKIILSGCGTSGRLAYCTATKFNKVFQKFGYHENIYHTHAGGVEALFASKEMSEDSATAGVGDLVSILDEKTCSGALLVGISCGLSAPYVAGQLNYCLSSSGVRRPIIIGFNPVSMAREVVPEGCKENFRQLLEQMDAGCIINPVVGPEPIAGSTRMKGGSATKIILDSVFMAATSRVVFNENISVESLLRATQSALCSFYDVCLGNLPRIISRCSWSNLQGGRIFYLSLDESGIWALLDAAECLPTYGISADSMRAFVAADCLKLLGNHFSTAANCHITADCFVETVLSSLQPLDTVNTVTSKC